MNKAVTAVVLLGLIIAVSCLAFFGMGKLPVAQEVIDYSFRSGYADGYERGMLEGFNEGFEDGYVNGTVDGAGSGYNIRNPTYREVVDFVASDMTDLHFYDEVSYNCFHFVRDFKSNAFDAGLKAGFVYVEFVDGAHGIVCFDTVDFGLIFVEPQRDSFVSLVVGQDYEFVEEPNRVVSFTIIW